ncbi:MAG TPA: NUDIX hydrolase [Acidimicrobiales bacterium]|nr:NUDIX hydrolase [Acidimicrobiales bacterium]
MATEVRDAATVVLLRDEALPEGGTSLEVFMVRRHARSGFVGGHHVFPGGVVDEDDRDPEWSGRCRGRFDPFAVAAIRELLEEAGVLLAAHRDTGAPVAIGPARVGALARAVHDGRQRFIDACRAEDLEIRVDDLALWSHWITPEGEPRRYDTRFFAAVAPADQEAIHDDLELTEGTWGSPASFLEQHRLGEIQMILPTVATLRSIETLTSSADVLEVAAAKGPIEPTAPELRREPDGSASIFIDGQFVWTLPPPSG